MSENIIVLKLQSRGMPGTGISEIEKNQITSDIAELQGRPEIHALDQVPDVDVAGVTDGQALMWDADTETWVPGSASEPISGFDNDIDRNAVVPDVREIFPRNGLAGVASGSDPNRYILQPTYGTTANTVAAGNHTHMQPLPVRVTTAPTGYMSGGSRSIGTTSVALTNGVQHVVEAAVYGQVRGADPGAAYYTITLNIGGNTYTSPGGSDGFWCVQGVPDKPLWEYERRMTGTGASVSVSASIAFHSGSGFNVDRMYLRVRVRPDR